MISWDSRFKHLEITSSKTFVLFCSAWDCLCLPQREMPIQLIYYPVCIQKSTQNANVQDQKTRAERQPWISEIAMNVYWCQSLCMCIHNQFSVKLVKLNNKSGRLDNPDFPRAFDLFSKEPSLSPTSLAQWANFKMSALHLCFLNSWMPPLKAKQLACSYGFELVYIELRGFNKHEMKEVGKEEQTWTHQPPPLTSHSQPAFTTSFFFFFLVGETCCCEWCLF